MKKGWAWGVVLGRREWDGMKWVERRREERGVRWREGIFLGVWWALWWTSWLRVVCKAGSLFVGLLGNPRIECRR